jgi:hypothetical protein
MRKCIIPATVMHDCCEMDPKVVNRQIQSRLEAIQGGQGSAQAAAGGGATRMARGREQEWQQQQRERQQHRQQQRQRQRQQQQQQREQQWGLPVEDSPMPLAPEQDLGGLGGRNYGYEYNGEGVLGGFDGDGGWGGWGGSSGSGSGSGSQTLPGGHDGAYTGGGGGTQDTTLDLFGFQLPSEHDQIHYGQPCMLGDLWLGPPTNFF